MNGAESLLRTAVSQGVDVCFTNPGTTEMPLVAALDSVTEMRGVLALFEGVVTGAADGYGRMSGRPALTLLHLGPGFANGIANLHNARRARTPIVNLIGHHTTWIRNYDPPLNSDVEQLAAPVSSWVRTSAAADQLSRDTATAIATALGPPGQVTTLVVPANCQWEEAGSVLASAPPPVSRGLDAERIDRAARALSGNGGLLLIGGNGLLQAGLEAAARISAKTGCRLMSQTFPARLERGPHLPALERLPYFPEQVQEALAKASALILAGADEPVSFFGYPNVPSGLCPEGVEMLSLATATEDAAAALEALALALDATVQPGSREVTRPTAPSGALSPSSIAQALVATQPENAIIVDEGVTAAGAYYPVSQNAPAHSYLALTGGAIGFGLPCGTGAALACPDRRVIVLEGDGSGLYTAQAFWTQARESLNVTNLVFANSVYRILQVELARAGVSEPGPRSLALTDLSRPTIDWVALSQGLGVPATRVETAEALTEALAKSFATAGPQTIEVALA